MIRLDKAVQAQVRSRTRAQKLIRSGKVQVNGKTVLKPSFGVGEYDVIEVENDRWVSRAAYKLLGALEGLQEAGIQLPESPRVLDAGASTGGFTQVMLDAGARRIYAVDVGHDQLDEAIRSHERVEVREGLNLRDLVLSDLDSEPVDLIVGDVSFISLKLLLKPLAGVLKPDGLALLLVKPQFEVGKDQLGAGGVVRSDELRRESVTAVIEEARGVGWNPIWSAGSKLPGPSGNREIFVCFSASGQNN